MTDLLTLTGSKGAVLHLVGVTTLEDGLSAEGRIAEVQLRKGRVFTAPDGKRYHLAQAVPPGVTWTETTILERR